MAFQTTMQRGAGQLRHRCLESIQAVVERQQRVLAKRHDDGFLFDRQDDGLRDGWASPMTLCRVPFPPLGQRPQALLTMLYRSTNRRCRAGAPVKYLAHNASFSSCEKYAPSNAGTKQIGSLCSLPNYRSRASKFRPGLTPS